MIKDLAIIGAGGFGREVAWLVERINREEKTWNLKGFIDDQQPIGTKVNQYTVIGTTENIKQSEKIYMSSVPSAMQNQKKDHTKSGKHQDNTLCHRH